MKNWLDKYQKGSYVFKPKDRDQNLSSDNTKTFIQTSNGNIPTIKEDKNNTIREVGLQKQAEKKAEEKRIAERKAAKAVQDGQAKTFTFPNGQTKSIDQMNWREKNYIAGKSLETRGRFNEDKETWYDDYINPVNWVTSMAGNLGEAPYTAQQTNSNLPYLTSIGTPLLMGRTIGSGTLNPFSKQFYTHEVSNPEFLNNLALGVPKGLENISKNPIVRNAARTMYDIPRAESIKEAIGRISGIPLKKDLPRMAAEDVKALRQVQEIGRLRATNTPYAEQMKYGLENNLPEEHFQKVFGKSREEAQQLLDRGFAEQEAVRSAGIRGRIDLRRNRSSDSDIDVTGITEEDIRSNIVQNIVDRFSQPEGIEAYLRERINQLPPPPEYINLNIDNPRRGIILIPNMDRSRVGLSQELKRNINDQTNRLDKKLEDFLISKSQDYPYHSGKVLEKVPSLSLEGSGNLKNVSKKVSFAPESIQSGDIFTGSTNTSHSSYLPQLKQVFKYTKGDPQFLGYKPMNSLGFLSNFGYEEEDVAKYLNSEIDEQIKRGVLPKNIQRPFIKGKSVLLPHYGIKQYKKGGVIKDDRGQWAHPGEITEIGSNKITMQGVPYPVLGISDTGHQQVMHPGQDYIFDGNSVVEYPLMNRGGTTWLNEYQDGGLSVVNQAIQQFKDQAEYYNKLNELKKRIANAETYSSEDPYTEINNSSGALGKYQFIPLFNTELVDKYPHLQDFLKNPQAQEDFMNNKIPEYWATAYKLKEKYPELTKSYSADDLAILTHFQGAAGLEKRLVGKTMDVSTKKNPSPNSYLRRTRGDYKKQNGGWLTAYK